MKTIAEKAKEYANGVFEDFIESVDFFTSEDIENAVKHGVELAQKWISVEDELPEKGKTVLIINNFGFEGVGCYDGKIWKFYSIDILTNSFNIKECVVGGFTNITHWRIIDLK